MSDRWNDTEPTLSKTEARSGRKEGVGRWVLGISLALVIIGMVILFAYFF